MCNETIGKTATAWSQFRLAEVASQADHREDRVTLAREHLAALLPKLSVITVQVSDAQRVPGLRLTVDGLAWGEPLWNVPTPIDPGVHTVVAEAPSRGTRAFPVSVGTRAQKLLVVIDLPAVVPLPAALGLSRSREPERGAPAASPPPQPPVAPSGLVARPVSGAVPAPGAGREEAAAPQPRSLSFVLACVAAGIGASALIVGSVYGLQAFSRWDSRNTLCPMNQCTDAAGIQAQIGAENAARDADVSVVLGLAALSASGYFFYRWHEERTEELTAEPRSWSLAPSVSMRQAGLRLEHGW